MKSYDDWNPTLTAEHSKEAASGFCPANTFLPAIEMLRRFPAHAATRIFSLDVDVHMGNSYVGHANQNFFACSVHADTSRYYPWLSNDTDSPYVMNIPLNGVQAGLNECAFLVREVEGDPVAGVIQSCMEFFARWMFNVEKSLCVGKIG